MPPPNAPPACIALVVLAKPAPFGDIARIKFPKSVALPVVSSGNGTDFGDLSAGKENVNGCSSNTRGIFAGGYQVNNADIDIIEYITIANTGDVTDFGDLTAATSNMNGCTSNQTTAVMNRTGNVIETVTIASTGNASDFGDLTVSRSNRTCATGNLHGGIAA